MALRRRKIKNPRAEDKTIPTHDPYIYGDRPPAYYGARSLYGIVSDGLVAQPAPSINYRARELKDVPAVFFGPYPVVAEVWGETIFRFPWPDVYAVDSAVGNSSFRYQYKDFMEGTKSPLFQLIGPDLWMWYYTPMSIPPEDIDVWNAVEGVWEPLISAQRNPRGESFFAGVDDVGLPNIDMPEAVMKAAFGKAEALCTDFGTLGSFLRKSTTARLWVLAPEQEPLREFFAGIHPQTMVCVGVLGRPEDAFAKFLRYHEQGHILFRASIEVQALSALWVQRNPAISQLIVHPYGNIRLPQHLYDRAEKAMGPDKKLPPALEKEVVRTAQAELWSDIWALNRLEDEKQDLDLVYRTDGLLRHVAIGPVEGLKLLTAEQIALFKKTLKEYAEQLWAYKKAGK